MVVTEPEFKEWLEHPVTKAVRKMLGKVVADHQEAWASGDFTAATIDAAIQMNAKAIGYTQALQYVLSLSHAEYEEVITDASPAQGNVPPPSAFDPRDAQEKRES